MGDTVPFELIRKASEGDSEVFEQVFAPLLEPAYYLALGLLQDRELAEEAVIKATQQAFASLGDVRAGTSLRKWFVSIVLRQCRSAKPLPAVVPTAEELDATKTPDQLLSEALMALRYQDRGILIMHHYVDLPIDEVAQLEGLSIEATRGRLDKTMTRLGPLFADDSGWFRLDEMVIAKRLHDLIDGIGPPSPDFWEKIRKALAKPPTRRDRLQGVIAVCAALLAVAVVLTIPAGFKNYTHTKAVLQQQAPPLLADILKESPIPLPSPLTSAAAPEPSPQDSPTGKKSPQPGGGGGATNNPPPDPGSPSISPASVHDGEVAVGYSPVTFGASGGSGGPYTFSAPSGLPSGLAMSSAGVLSGNPTGTGCNPCNLTVQVTDSNNRSSTSSFAFVIYPQLQISGVFRPGEVNVAYGTSPLSATGGKPGTYSWTLTPNGTGFTPTSGTGSSFTVGAPPAGPSAGTATLKLTDAFNTTGVPAAATPVPHVTLAPVGTLQTCTRAVPCNKTIGTIASGVAPYAYVSATNLPPGSMSVVVSGTSVNITGTPSATIAPNTTYDIVVTIRDGCVCIANGAATTTLHIKII